MGVFLNRLDSMTPGGVPDQDRWKASIPSHCGTWEYHARPKGTCSQTTDRGAKPHSESCCNKAAKGGEDKGHFPNSWEQADDPDYKPDSGWKLRDTFTLDEDGRQALKKILSEHHSDKNIHGFSLTCSGCTCPAFRF